MSKHRPEPSIDQKLWAAGLQLASSGWKKPSRLNAQVSGRADGGPWKHRPQAPKPTRAVSQSIIHNSIHNLGDINNRNTERNWKNNGLRTRTPPRSQAPQTPNLKSILLHPKKLHVPKSPKDPKLCNPRGPRTQIIGF